MVDNPRLLPFPIASTTGELADANQIVVDNSDPQFSGLGEDAQLALQNLQNQINGIVIPGQPSFRPFRTFTGGTLVSNVNFRIEEITLDGTNFAEWNDINSIYAAGRVNKRVDILLPTDAEITASGESYPVAIEVTHLGGTDRVPADGRPNVVNFIVKSTDTGTQIDTVNLGTRNNIGLSQGDVSVLTKNAAGQNWSESRATRDPSATLLPDGVFDLREDIVIDNMSNFSTLLTGVVITAGEGFHVVTGGTYFGGNTIPNNVALVALVDNPSLADTNANENWLVVPNAVRGPSDMSDRLLLNQFTQTGTRFDASRNVFVNEANVIQFSAMAAATPLARGYFDSAGDGTPRQRQFTNQGLRFADLRGGTLSLSVAFASSQNSGFLPELTSLVLDYGGGNVFTFPLTGVNPEDGMATVDITIPNADYTSILDTDCDVTLNYVFRGATFIGTFTIMALVNTLDGTLRQAVTNIANNAAMMAEQRVGTQITQLAGEIDNDGAALAAIQPRISPYKNVTVSTPEVEALFNDSSGSDPFPSDLSTLNEVSADNPRYTSNSTSIFVAVPAPGTYVLRNITSSTDTALSDSEPSVTLGESRMYQGRTYFVYRVTGLTSGHVFEVENQTQSQVVAWPDDIENHERRLDEIDAELSHAALNLSDEVIHVLEDLTVTEESSPTVSATTYNNQLSGSASATQSVFYEPNENAGSGGSKNSRPFSELSGDQVQRKLLYVPESTPANQVSYVTAFDGTTGRDLISYANGVYSANVFVPAKNAGSSTETIYPAQATRVSGAGIWQTIEALTFVGGVPTAEADEVFFTRNIPSQPVTLNIAYRGHANGNPFGAATTTLAGVGGPNEVFANFTLNDGSEQAFVEVRWSPQARNIRVSVTERVNTGLPTINDIQVILSYDETRVIPATPATTRQVDIEHVHDGVQVFAFRPATSGNLAIVGDRTEIDTGYSYATLFGATGFLTIADQNARFLNFEDFTPIASTVQNLEDHASLPQFGLFVTTYTRETVLSTNVTIQPDGFNVGNLPTSATGLASGDLWNNSGTLAIVP